MYPDFRYLLHGLFGIDAPQWLSIFKTFGFFVAIGFIAAAWAITSELRRKEKAGLLLPEYETMTVGQPASFGELLVSAIVGFIIGAKAGGIILDAAEAAPNPLGYVLSLKGSIVFGILGAAVAAYIRYADKTKKKLDEPVTKKLAVYPHQRVGEIVVIAAVGGLAGAKIFNAFETWDSFVKDPIGSLFSSAGLTFYGGLIVATIALYYYGKKHKIAFHHLCDAAAPGLMLAYGLGRFGCQFAGDGDWGIFNSAYVTDAAGHLQHAAPEAFHAAVGSAQTYFLHDFGSIDKVAHAYAPAPGWLPDWLFAMNYPYNVNNEGVPLANCMGDYCHVLPVGVFPTPLYEAITCIILFFVLWAIRKKIVRPLHLFGVYLILNGVERFFVEKIRVNYKYDWGFIHPTQAEIISTCLVLAGVGILLFYKKKNEPGIPGMATSA